MTPSEAIKNAWGKTWEKIGEPARRMAIREKGFVWDYHLRGLRDLPDMEIQESNAGERFRPSVLSGIDVNNGWLEFPDEECKKSAPCDLWACDWNGCRLPILIKEGNPINKKLTHYIKIQVPKPILFNEYE